MNAALVKRASEVILNPGVLVNLISRRVRQLNDGARAVSQVSPADPRVHSAADIALIEIIEGTMTFEMPEPVALTRPSGKNRNRPKHWTSAE
jgi:DNA-directed RNA polymerase subunit omega